MSDPRFTTPAPPKFQPPTQPSATPATNPIARSRNLIIAIAAIVLSAALATGITTPSSAATLSTLADRAIAYDVALSNDKPTLVEFYANWCTSCQAMAPAIAELEDVYNDRINFVMLNVDNTNWLPEMDKYNVDGIPLFVLLDANNQTVATTIGEQPKSVLNSALASLVNGQAIAAETNGETSTLDEEPTNRLQPTGDPRGHGAIAPAA